MAQHRTIHMMLRNELLMICQMDVDHSPLTIAFFNG